MTSTRPTSDSKEPAWRLSAHIEVEQRPAAEWGESVTTYSVDAAGCPTLEAWCPATICAALRARLDSECAAGRHPSKFATVRLVAGPRRAHLGTLSLSGDLSEGWEEIRASLEARAGQLGARFAFELQEWSLPSGGPASPVAPVPARAAIGLPVPGYLSGQACLAYALAADGRRHEMLDESGVEATVAALELGESIGVGCRQLGLEGVDMFVRRHPSRSVTVLGPDATVVHRARGAIAGRDPDYLLFHTHYYFIPRVDVFVKESPDSTDVWCHECARLYSRSKFRGHACEERCGGCLHYFSSAADRKRHMRPPEPRKKVCGYCRQTFRYGGCRKYHRCEKWRCELCGGSSPLARMGAHQCGEEYCERCKVYTMPADSESGGRPPHRCFVARRPAPDRSGPGEAAYVFGTSETADGLIAVVVALAVGTRESHVFKGEAAAQDFLQWACARRTVPAVFLTHGALPSLLGAMAAHEAPPQAADVNSDGVVTAVKFHGVRFVDTQAVSPGPELAGSRRHGKTDEFFPVKAFLAANLGYSGPIPETKYFPDSFAAGTSAFLGWHKERQFDALAGDDYVLLDEAVKRCRLGVEASCLALEKLWAAAAAIGVELFGPDTSTAASAAWAHFLRRHLAENSLPVLTPTECDFAEQVVVDDWAEARQLSREWSEETARRGGGAVCVTAVAPELEVLLHERLPCGAPWWLESEVKGERACEAFLADLKKRRRCAVVECEVKCPRAAHHPVLLTRRGGRVCAPLDLKRGTWTSVELDRALEMGYKVVRVAGALCSETSGDLCKSFAAEAEALRRLPRPAGDPSFDVLSRALLRGMWETLSTPRPARMSGFFTQETEWRRLVGRGLSGDVARLDVVAHGRDGLLATADLAGGEAPRLSTGGLVRVFAAAHARLRVHRMLCLLGPRVLYHGGGDIVYELSHGGFNVPLDPDSGWRLAPECVPSGGAEGAVPIVEFCGLGPRAYAFRSLSGAERVVGPGPFARLRAAADEVRGAICSDGAPSPRAQAALQFGDGWASPEDTTFALQSVAIVSAELTLPHGHAELVRYDDEEEASFEFDPAECDELDGFDFADDEPAGFVFREAPAFEPSPSK